MKLRVMSDLHLNFSELELPHMLDDLETVLVLPGDVCEIAHGKETYRAFFEDVNDRFKFVFYVFGNHEYYGDSYLRAYDHFMRQCGHLDKIKVLDMDTVVLDDVAFIGCTLWTDMDKGNPLLIEEARWSMNDYQMIRMGNYQTPYHRRLMPADTVRDHYAMKRWLFDEVYKAKQLNQKTVVVTHHHPSYMKVPERFKGDSLNGCYCSEMFNDVELSGPDLWLCGHMHTYTDYTIGKTRVLCNPRGYQTIPSGPYGSYKGEDTGFNLRLTLEI